jgi:hypothetical protein
MDVDHSGAGIDAADFGREGRQLIGHVSSKGLAVHYPGGKPRMRRPVL